MIPAHFVCNCRERTGAGTQYHFNIEREPIDTCVEN